MKVDVKDLGGGLFSLIPTPTVCGEYFPSHVMDRIMKDVIAKEREKRCSNSYCRRSSGVCDTPTHFCEHNLEPKKRSYAQLNELKRWGEPDGIDVHVDRPLRENFISHKDWALAMAKYRTLEDVAKDCDWECREPMKGTDFYRSCPTPSNTWVNENWDDDWFDNDDDDEWDELSCLWNRY